MVYETSLISDGMLNPDKKVRDRVEDDLGLLTPILKVFECMLFNRNIDVNERIQGFLTETSLEAASHGMQVWGGHGFIVDNVAEQIYRDARISTLYEGISSESYEKFILITVNRNDWYSSFGSVGKKDYVAKGKTIEKIQPEDIEVLQRYHLLFPSPKRTPSIRSCPLRQGRPMELPDTQIDVEGM